MTDPLARLKAALADSYAIERELGAGGMATVYLAQDLKHRRKVAVKVLRAELAAILGAAVIGVMYDAPSRYCRISRVVGRADDEGGHILGHKHTQPDATELRATSYELRAAKLRVVNAKSGKLENRNVVRRSWVDAHSTPLPHSRPLRVESHPLRSCSE